MLVAETRDQMPWELGSSKKVSLAGERGGTQGELDPLLLNFVTHGGDEVGYCWGTVTGFAYPSLPIHSATVLLGVCFNKRRYHSFPFSSVLWKEHLTWCLSGALLAPSVVHPNSYTSRIAHSLLHKQRA